MRYQNAFLLWPIQLSSNGCCPLIFYLKWTPILRSKAWALIYKLQLVRLSLFVRIMPRDQIRHNVALAISHGAIEQTPAYVACLKKVVKNVVFRSTGGMGGFFDDPWRQAFFRLILAATNRTQRIGRCAFWTDSIEPVALVNLHRTYKSWVTSFLLTIPVSISKWLPIVPLFKQTLP